MPVTDSRVLTGSLKFSDTEDMTAAVDFSCQPRAVSIVPPDPPSQAAADLEYVLCGDPLPSEDATTGRDSGWTLNVTAVQDFEDPDGLQAYAFGNDGALKYFQLKLSPTSPTWSGQVTVYAMTEGGNVKERITADAVWPITGKPTRTPHA